MKILLTIRETADAVSISESKIRRMVAESRFPAPIAIDGNVRWRMSDLNEWEKKLCCGEIAPSQIKRGRPRLAV